MTNAADRGDGGGVRGVEEDLGTGSRMYDHCRIYHWVWDLHMWVSTFSFESHLSLSWLFFLHTFLSPAPGGVLKNTGSINMSLMVCNISFIFIQRISQSNKFKSQFLKVWILSGLFSMVGAYCYAELGLLIRKVSKMTICTTCTLLI